jgi:hypothetical protein
MHSGTFGITCIFGRCLGRIFQVLAEEFTMDNKFTTVISYEKPIQDKRQDGNVMLSGDVGALMKALGFMALWLVLTVMLLAEPLMLNSSAARAKQEHQNFTLHSAPAAIENNAAKRAPQPVRAHPNAKLNAEPSSTELPPARLSYALLSVK